ncbi:MAG: response regulator transcription factor [Chloroflexi bacterium]|nr:MAG: hypothetical protein AUG02_01695 [Chloroflexi bacterium 13_1_20CM_2_70_9]TME90759.1 MAG: response regulator transcription factor [Chloroflexota bacterium]
MLCHRAREVVGTSVNGDRPEILVVDDDRDLVDLLAFLIEQAGLASLVAYDPAGALEVFDKERPAVAIIDLNLDPWDGFELVGQLRQRSATLPIVVLTGLSKEEDKVRAFDIGADDYVVKPFGHREFVARLRAHVRRSDLAGDPQLPEVLEVGPLRLDVAERILHIDGEPRRLTGTEFRLLHYLMRHRGAVVPTARLAKHVWGYNDAPARDSVRVTVHRLRRKLGDDGGRRHFIHTVPGVGLKLRAS